VHELGTAKRYSTNENAIADSRPTILRVMAVNRHTCT